MKHSAIVALALLASCQKASPREVNTGMANIAADAPLENRSSATDQGALNRIVDQQIAGARNGAARSAGPDYGVDERQQKIERRLDRIERQHHIDCDMRGQPC